MISGTENEEQQKQLFYNDITYNCNYNPAIFNKREKEQELCVQIIIGDET